MPKAVVVKDSKIHGKGVFALRDFCEGDLVLEIDDSHPVFDRNKLTSEQSKYKIDLFIDKDGKEKVVFARSPERYINHSCDPNVYVKTDLRSGIRKAYALREIREVEELTCGLFRQCLGEVGSASRMQLRKFQLSQNSQRKFLYVAERHSTQIDSNARRAIQEEIQRTIASAQITPHESTNGAGRIDADDRPTDNGHLC